jgi:hypothetical protein
VGPETDRIDGYLLLGRSLLYLDKMPQAAGLFQYLVESADQDDLFTIAIDGLQFTRLAGGRPLFADRPQSIDYAGDTDAGVRIVENLAYVI